jgi:hypothetical protein
MALTAAVVPGNTIMATWGNEIRNRTIQVFASDVEMQAWAAPNGALCYRTDQRRYYTRTSNAWQPLSISFGQSIVTTTNAQSDIFITHGMGAQPRSAIITPTNDVPSFVTAQIVALTTTQIQVRCRNSAGVGLANSAVSCYWFVIL